MGRKASCCIGQVYGPNDWASKGQQEDARGLGLLGEAF
jgi:hypothetical protein